MFLSVRRCAEPMTQLPRLRFAGQCHLISCLLHISWTLWAIFIKLQPNVPLSETMCRTYDSTMQTQSQGHTSRSCDLPFCPLLNSFEQFSLNFTQMFSQWDCVQRKWTSYLDSMSHWIYPLILCPLHIWFPERYSLSFIQMIFSVKVIGFTPLHISSIHYAIFIKLHPNASLLRQLQNLWLGYADSMSRLHFKVMWLIRSISPEPFEWFSLNFTQMFSQWDCVQRKWPSYLDSMSHVKIMGFTLEFWTLCSIFIKLHPNVPLSERICRTYHLATQTEGHTSRSCDLPFKLCPLYISWIFEWFSLNFIQMFLSLRRCAELMTQLCRLKVKVTLKGHGIYLWISWTLHISSTIS